MANRTVEELDFSDEEFEKQYGWLNHGQIEEERNRRIKRRIGRVDSNKEEVELCKCECHKNQPVVKRLLLK